MSNFDGAIRKLILERAKRYIRGMGKRRTLKIFAHSFFALSGLEILLALLNLAGWLGTSMNWWEGIPNLWVGLAVGVPVIVGLILLWGVKQLGNESESTLGTFDFSAREAAEYVMKELTKDLNQATEWVTQMVKEERIHIRAVERGHSTDSPVAPEILKDNKLHLIGSDRDHQLHEHFGGAFHDEGWIAGRIKMNLDDPLIYHSPRFQSGEIKEQVRQYKADRPNSSS